MTKYIVKNCFSLDGVLDAKTKEIIHEDYCINANEYCSKITDCPIKQVVELCKDETDKEVHRWGDVVLIKNNTFAKRILQTLDVQEVEQMLIKFSSYLIAVCFAMVFVTALVIAARTIAEDIKEDIEEYKRRFK